MEFALQGDHIVNESLFNGENAGLQFWYGEQEFMERRWTGGGGGGIIISTQNQCSFSYME